MFCPDCGSEVAEGRKFCGKCGGRLNAGAVGNAGAAPSVPQSYQETVVRAPSRPVSSRQKLVYAIVALLVVLGGVGWWWFHRPAPAYKVQDPGIYPFQGLSADGKTQKWGFIDADGKVLVQPEWDAVAYAVVFGQPIAFSEGLCGVQKDGKWGYIDTGGHMAIPNQFDSASPFIEGLAKVKLGTQVGYIDKTGQYAINPQFHAGLDFHEGLAGVEGDDGWGFIDKAGTYVNKFRFQFIDNYGFSDGLAFACRNSKCGYVDRTGTFVIKPQFNVAISSTNTFSEGMAAVEINGKSGFIDTSGKMVINPQFDLVSSFSGGLAVVQVSGNSGTINKQGKYVVNPGQLKMGVSAGSVGWSWGSEGLGLITRDGKWVVKPSKAITDAGPIFGKVFQGQVAGQMVPISMSGKVLAGPYKGAMLDTLAQDIENENKALGWMMLLTDQEAQYSAAYPAKGFAASLAALGPGQGVPNESHASYIDAELATGSKDGYQFVISIPAGTSTGGTNFNYFLVAKPAAGRAGRAYCADSSGTVRGTTQGEECSLTSPVLSTASARRTENEGIDTPQPTPH